jgi:acetyl esterase/lipase
MMKKFQILLILLLFPFLGFSQENFRVVQDVIYGRKFGMALTYDVFLPTGNPNGAGIIHVVSGAWSSKYHIPDSIVVNYKSYLDRGYAVFALRHSSNPRFDIVEAVRDVQTGTWHIHDNAFHYGVDSARLGIFGGSSGGQLSLMAALPGEKHPVSAVVAFFPPADLRNIPDIIKAMIPAMDMDSVTAREVSPVLFASPDDPPVLLIHGTSDFMVSPWQSENMYKALQDHGVPSKLILYDGMGHGNAFGAKGEYYDSANNELIKWFDQYLLRPNQP